MFANLLFVSAVQAAAITTTVGARGYSVATMGQVSTNSVLPLDLYLRIWDQCDENRCTGKPAGPYNDTDGNALQGTPTITFWGSTNGLNERNDMAFDLTDRHYEGMDDVQVDGSWTTAEKTWIRKEGSSEWIFIKISA